MVLGRLESRTLAWARDRSGNLRRPRRVGRDAELGSAAVTRPTETIVEGCEEWVELGGDVLDPGVDLGTSLTNDAEDLLASLSSRDGVTLDLDVDVIFIQVVGGPRRNTTALFFGDLDAGTRLLLQGLDGGALTPDDVSTGRLGDRNFDGLLPESSISVLRFHETSSSTSRAAAPTVDPMCFTSSLRAC